ncbi:MAG TPA: cation:proton antiporter [Steroidobacteraceae bacterium]|nr:cation:proton antiporter [Steroidobacteraceae bacterium]
MATPSHRIDFVLLRRPALAAVVALALGMILGPLGLRILQPELVDDGAPIESLSEIALLLCLFCAGLRLRVPLEWRHWRMPGRLATLTLGATVAIAAAVAHLMFGMSLTESLLLGAIVAPTDSVLGSDAGPHPEGDHEGSAFVLAAEGGANNGLATGLVMLVLAMMGLSDSDSDALGTISLAALWAIGGGFLVGWLTGAAAARCIMLFDPERKTDFLEEGMVFATASLAYGAALLIHTDGFPAVFAAGVALCHGGRLRRTLRNRPLMPRVLRIAARVERFAWLAIIVLLGSLVASVEFRARMLVFALLLLLLIRPLAVRLGLGGLAVPEAQWRSIAWFTPRGIGCLYCLSFAINHGLSAPFSRELAGITLVVIVSSLIASGISGLPLRRASPGTVDL